MTRRRPRMWRGFVALVTGLLVLVPAAPAFAHGGGDSDQSRVLVVDALTYLANKPADYMDHVTDKVGDALEAPDPSGVDLTKVAAAQRALKAGDMAAVRRLLQASLEPLAAPVTGEQTGTATMPDPMSGQTTWAGSGAVLAAVSALALLVGLGLARRWRPHRSLDDLRAQLTGGQPR